MIMDYEQKYKAALEWMQGMYGGLHGKTKKEAEKYFPELQESEDEKVKRIIHSISNKISFHLHDIFTEEEFQCFDAWSNAWLKKQGSIPKEVTYTQEVIAWLEKLGQKPKWTDEDEERLQSCIIELQGKGLMGGVDTIDTKWLKSLKQRLEK
jgi:hypothetical protein